MSILQDKVIVVGGGLMGTGIAHAFASAGFTTVLVDSNTAAATKALAAVAKILDDGVKLGKVEASAAVGTFISITREVKEHLPGGH